jgi:hypothetical protein
MARIPNKTIIKFLIRHADRIEKAKKGHSFDYAPGEYEFTSKALNQILIDYKDYEYVQRPIGQSPLSFKAEINRQPDLFENIN